MTGHETRGPSRRHCLYALLGHIRTEDQHAAERLALPQPLRDVEEQSADQQHSRPRQDVQVYQDSAERLVALT